MTESSRVYLDYAATAPTSPSAVAAMTAAFAQVGNASSLHASGRAARRRLEEARESVARTLGAHPSEVLFTSGGTEADNLAVKGIYRARRAADPRRTVVVTSPVEHHAVLEAVAALVREEGAESVLLPVDDAGRVDPEDLARLLEARGDEVALVSVMWANNEIGTVEPIAELAAVAAAFEVPMHSDAVQAVGHLPVDFRGSGLAALSLSAHKFGGPVGIGALLLGRTVAAKALVHGGGHERELRSGTLMVPLAVGMAAALAEADAASGAEAERLTELAAALIAGITELDGRAVVNGSRTARLPGNVHVTFPDAEGESLLMLLDAAGIEVSTGSACTAGVAAASHVLLALGVDDELARGSLRFSLGSGTTHADVRRVLEVLPEALERARRAGTLAARTPSSPVPVRTSVDEGGAR